jgi:hypothetical protein
VQSRTSTILNRQEMGINGRGGGELGDGGRDGCRRGQSVDVECRRLARMYFLWAPQWSTKSGTHLLEYKYAWSSSVET